MLSLSLVIKLAQFSSFGKYYYHHRFCATVCLMLWCVHASQLLTHTHSLAAHTPNGKHTIAFTQFQGHARSFGNLLTIPQKPICTCRNVGRSTYQRQLCACCKLVSAQATQRRHWHLMMFVWCHSFHRIFMCECSHLNLLFKVFTVWRRGCATQWEHQKLIYCNWPSGRRSYQNDCNK